ALELDEDSVKKGNRNATTDAAVAILLAESAIRGAILNYAVNLASIRDETFRSNAEDRVEQLLKRADEIGHEAMAVVTERLRRRSWSLGWRSGKGSSPLRVYRRLNGTDQGIPRTETPQQGVAAGRHPPDAGN